MTQESIVLIHDISQMNSLIVRRFAQEVIGPKVREMDEKESMDPAIIKGLFEQGASTHLY